MLVAKSAAVFASGGQVECTHHREACSSTGTCALLTSNKLQFQWHPEKSTAAPISLDGQKSPIAIAVSKRCQLAQAIPQFHVQRMLHEPTPISRSESQHKARSLWTNLCVLGAFYNGKRPKRTA